MDNINIKMEICIKAIGYKMWKQIETASLFLHQAPNMKEESKMGNIMEKVNSQQVLIYTTKGSF